MEKNKLKSITAPLSKFMPWSGKEQYITITEWANGEGYDLSIDDRCFQLHRDELDAINYLSKVLDYDFE